MSQQQPQQPDDRSLSDMDTEMYEAYSEWLMENEQPMWKDRLISLLEDGHRFGEFLRSRKP